jgi:hypothetical protein
LQLNFSFLQPRTVCKNEKTSHNILFAKMTPYTLLFIIIACTAEKVPYTNGMLAEIVHDSLVITPSLTIIPDTNTMVRDLFNIFDSLPKDGYLSYREIKIFQFLTNPELPLTAQIWKWICEILHSNHKIGIDVASFNSSYYNPARDQMGTDIIRDWSRVNEASLFWSWK